MIPRLIRAVAIILVVALLLFEMQLWVERSPDVDILLLWLALGIVLIVSGIVLWWREERQGV